MEFKKIKSIDDINELQIRQQAQIVKEMVELLPQKLDKMSASLK